MKKMIGFLVFGLLMGCMMGICSTPDTANTSIDNQNQNPDFSSIKVIRAAMIIFFILIVIGLFYNGGSSDSDDSKDSDTGFRHGWKWEKYFRDHRLR